MALLANLKQNTSNVANWAGQHKSGICMWLSLASLVTTVICVADEAPKAKEALKKLHEKQEEEGVELTKPAKIWEDTKTVAPIVWPAAVSFVATAGFEIAGHNADAKTIASLELVAESMRRKTAYYRRAAIEEFGDKADQRIRDRANKDIIEDEKKKNIKHESVPEEVICANPALALVYDVQTGRYFNATQADIQRAENELNRRVYSEMWVSINDFYYELGIKGIKLGEQLGWNADNPPRFECTFDACISEDGRPCLVLTYDIDTRYRYGDLDY